MSLPSAAGSLQTRPPLCWSRFLFHDVTLALADIKAAFLSSVSSSGCVISAGLVLRGCRGYESSAHTSRGKCRHHPQSHFTSRPLEDGSGARSLPQTSLQRILMSASNTANGSSVINNYTTTMEKMINDLPKSPSSKRKAFKSTNPFILTCCHGNVHIFNILRP